MDFEEIVKRRSAPTVTVRLPMENRLIDDFEKLRKEAAKTEVAANMSNDREVHIRSVELNRQLESMRQQIEDSRVAFVFQGIPRVEYNELVEQHPSRKEDRDNGFEFNPETLAPYLIAACAVDPELTVEQATFFWTEWTAAEGIKLYNAAYEANKVVRDIPFTVAGIGKIPLSDPNSDSATGSE